MGTESCEKSHEHRGEDPKLSRAEPWHEVGYIATANRSLGSDSEGRLGLQVFNVIAQLWI